MSQQFEGLDLEAICRGMLEPTANRGPLIEAKRELEATIFASAVPCTVTRNRYGCRVTCIQKLLGTSPASLDAAVVEIAGAVAARYGPESHVDRQGYGEVLRRTHRWQLPGAKLQITSNPPAGQVRYHYSR